MLAESLAIVTVILIMVVMVARTGRRTFAVLMLPLISVPVFHLLGYVLPPFGGWLMLLDVIGLVVGVIVCTLFSRGFQSKRAQLAYLICCCGFMTALTVAYLIRYL